MRVPHRVPEHNVRVLDRSVGGCPANESIAAGALVGIVAGAILLLVAVRRHPHMVLDKTRLLAPHRVLEANGNALSPGKNL